MKPVEIVAIGAAIIAAAAIIVTAGRRDQSEAEKSAPPAAPVSATLPDMSESYIGVYLAGVPNSYDRVNTFTRATEVRPDVIVYYSGWLEPFRAGFAAAAARSGAVPLIQIDPKDISLTAIASGQYDVYLGSYAAAVRSYGHAVILSFGHEMNGYWYSWANRHTPPAEFVAAWRHIVTLFHRLGADNVTWLWTVNVIDNQSGIPSPSRWWPGSSYVTWVGIDGYYGKSSLTFAPLFGPTIVAVRTLTSDPILIAETGAASAEGQPAKIADLFAGIRTYGLLGFVWFDAIGEQDWRIRTPSAVAAFRRGAEAYHGLAS